MAAVREVHEFRKFLALPRSTRSTREGGLSFEIALDIHPNDAKDLAALRESGWLISDPKIAAGDPATFRRYVQVAGWGVKSSVLWFFLVAQVLFLVGGA